MDKKTRQPIIGTIQVDVDQDYAGETFTWVEKRLQRIQKDLHKMGMIRTTVMVRTEPAVTVKRVSIGRIKKA
jgi:hypothetical protein